MAKHRTVEELIRGALILTAERIADRYCRPAEPKEAANDA